MGDTPLVVPTRTSRRFNLISAALAFAIWGGWAWYVNSRTTGPAGHASPVVSGLAQGTGSFIMTLVMVRSVAWLYRSLRVSFGRLVLPAAITVVATGSCFATGHALLGTPNIAQTIAPALSVAFVFNIYTTFKLHFAEESHDNRRIEEPA